MRALRYHGRRDVRLEDLPEPSPGPGEVLIRVAYNGLCGSDVHEYFEGPAATTVDPHPLTGCALPCVLGHEFSGQIAELGDGLVDLRIGQLVAVEPIETCLTCARCRSGHRHLCRKIAFHGYNRHGGGLSELTVVPRQMVHVLPRGLNALHGALVEPMAVARRAVRRTGIREAGRLVVVHGAGPIGLGALLALRDAGVHVVAVDPSPARRAAATALGAQVVVDPAEDDVASAVRDLTHGLGADAAIDAAGVPSAFSAALRSTRPDGIVVVVAHHNEALSLRSGHLIFNEIAITGSSIYDADDFAWVIDAMQRGAYPLDGWISTIQLDRAVEDGFEALREQRVNKVLVQLGDTTHETPSGRSVVEPSEQNGS